MWNLSCWHSNENIILFDSLQSDITKYINLKEVFKLDSDGDIE